jgi:hypothetical protein
MKSILPLAFMLVAAPSWAQIRAVPEKYLIRDGTEEPAAQQPVAPPVKLRPTQLLRGPDGKGGVVLQDTPCRPDKPSAAAVPASTEEVTDLSALQPRPQVAAPQRRVEEAPSRWILALFGAGKLALLLAAMYAVFWIGRYARDRYRQRYGEPEPPVAAPRRIR